MEFDVAQRKMNEVEMQVADLKARHSESIKQAKGMRIRVSFARYSCFDLNRAREEACNRDGGRDEAHPRGDSISSGVYHGNRAVGRFLDPHAAVKTCICQ